MARDKKTYENFDKVIKEIEEGKSLRRACKGIMDKSTFLDIVKEDEDRANQYAYAREEMIDSKFESIEDELNQPPKLTKSGNVDLGWVQLQRLKIDAKKWELSKLAPKKYGDKVDVDLTSGGDKITIKLDLGKDEETEQD